MYCRMLFVRSSGPLSVYMHVLSEIYVNLSNFHELIYVIDIYLVMFGNENEMPFVYNNKQNYLIRL